MKSLTRSQATERRMAGMDLDGCEIKSDVLKTQVNPRVRGLREQHHAGLISTDQLLERLSEPSDDLPQKIRKAAGKHSLFAGSDESGIDVIEVSDATAFVFDIRSDMYYRLEYELDQNNEARITGILTLTAKQMIQKNGSIVHAAIKENILDLQDAQAPKMRRLLEHLIEHEEAPSAS